MNKTTYRELIIKDMNNKKYHIKNFERFFEHINVFHSDETSIHEENGFYFQIDNDFRDRLKKFKLKEVEYKLNLKK